jgi:hypothetical protein
MLVPQGCQQSTIEQLPTEILQSILASLTIPALYSAILSCSALYTAFIGHELKITKDVVLGAINLDVMPEAIMALSSANGEPIDSYLNTRIVNPRVWTLPDLHSASISWLCVSAMSNDCAQKCFKTNTLLASNPPTHGELSRIQRSFYRIETHNNYREKISDHSDVPEEFFVEFCFWEDEQLACAYDYLIHAVRPGTCKITPKSRLKLRENHVKLHISL